MPITCYDTDFIPSKPLDQKGYLSGILIPFVVLIGLSLVTFFQSFSRWHRVTSETEKLELISFGGSRLHEDLTSLSSNHQVSTPVALRLRGYFHNLYVFPHWGICFTCDVCLINFFIYWHTCTVHVLLWVTPYLYFGAKEDSFAGVWSRLHRIENTVQSFRSAPRTGLDNR